MRGDTATETEGETEQKDPQHSERRPSLVNLQVMLKKVSQSPFHSQFTNPNSSGSEGNQFQNKQDKEPEAGPSVAAPGVVENQQLHLIQNGEGGDLSRRNPFYTYYMETSNKDIGRKTLSQDLDPCVAPPPVFSPLDHETEIQTLPNGVDLSAPQRDLFQPLPSNHLEMSTQETTANSHTVTMNSSDFFKVASVGATNFPKSAVLFKGGGVTSPNPFDATPKTFDPFTSPSEEPELSLSQHPSVTNPFHNAATGQADIFQAVKQDPPIKDLFSPSLLTNEDVFSPLSAHTPEPFPRTVTRDLLQDFSGSEEAHTNTPPSHYNPFTDVSHGTPDIFQPLPKDISSRSYPTSSLGSTDMLANVVLATPQRNSVLQATPPIQARSLSASSSQSSPEMTRISTFKRQPNPLPRRRQTKKTNPVFTENPPVVEKPPVPLKPPRPVKPTLAEKVETEPTVSRTFPKPALRSLPKPVIPHTAKTPENKVDPEDYIIFQDILFTGQEKCVEDWPDDSPQLNPGFKPSGTLRLRRESVKDKEEVDGSGDNELDGPDSNKKREKRFKMSLISRRGSKEKFPDEAKEEKSNTLPANFKSSKGSLTDLHASPGENDDGMEYKKKHLKTKVNQLLRRASTTSSVPEGKRTNGAEKDEVTKKSVSKADSFRRWSEGTVLDEGTEEEEGGEAEHVQKRKKKLKVKFVPQRGFTISLDKTDVKGAHGHTPSKGSKDDDFEDVEQLKAQLHSTSKAAVKDLHPPVEWNGEDAPYGLGDCKPKKSTKIKVLPVNRHSSKGDVLDEGSFSAEELEDDELSKMEDCRPKKSKLRGLIPTPRKQRPRSDQSDPAFTPQHTAIETFGADEGTRSESPFMSPGELYDREDEPDFHKPKKPVIKLPKKLKAKIKNMHRPDPPGATSSDYLSEAAKAEWKAAQMDESATVGLEDEEEGGDTDSLMEWWYTVEQWDEVPSDEDDRVDESKSFTILADKVQRGLRVFNKVFTERAEVLWQYIITLHAIADNISEFHQKAKIAGITGGTTTAVGGVTAVAGLVLAPFTFGASLVITAVGVGVATAGGITSASAAISDNINNMHDRKKVEIILQEYEAQLLDIKKILNFLDQGMYKLRGHPFLRSGTQHYSEYWEVRKAVQMVSLVDRPVMKAVEITDSAIASVQGLFKGMDKYFLKDSRELKKGCKKEVVAQIKQVANSLNDAIVTLNAIREELHDATGSI
ncbi:uncharacterized protein [Takifugu rubripes]|uniref:Uncharacterized LOC105416227 n=1 Tax=Takifugu rubripes TaxID=31033 RepID=A0A3B5K848_TAKRU|nr:uncharacterized protein LOC105416227 [Takifugu rubripes]